jgi:MraZ protein
LAGFLGSYLHQLDEKGRLALPAPFRRDAGDEGFVMIHFLEPALFLYPMRAWSGVEPQLVELMRRLRQSRGKVLELTGGAVTVVPDKQGRILIPERLQAVAQLDGQALIVGAIEKIEIWNPALFEKMTREAEPGIEQFLRQIIV